jgi:hypothetical protein
VFDTNAYRQLARNASTAQARSRAADLLDDEAVCQVQALVSPVVLLELLAHLADPSDPACGDAKAAIVLAFDHCAELVGSERHMRLFVDPDAQLARALYQRVPAEIAGGNDLIRAVAKRVAENPEEEALEQIRADLRTVADVVATAEAEFVDAVREHVVLGFNPEAKDWNPFPTDSELRRSFLNYLDSDLASFAIARMHVLRCQRLVGVSESVEEIDQKAHWVLHNFPVAIQFYKHLTRKIAESGYDLSGIDGGNNYWDMSVAFCVTRANTVEGRTLRLVTGDRALVRAAVSAGAGEAVLVYQLYRERLRARRLS